MDICEFFWRGTFKFLHPCGFLEYAEFIGMKTCLGLFEYCFAISYNFISFLFYVPFRPLVKKALQRFLIYLGGVMSLESSSLAYQVMMVAYYNQQTKRQKNLLPI